MSETWYVVPAAFALRNVARDEREDSQSTWILPEAWRKADASQPLQQPNVQPPVAVRSNG
jgi:hypothetical protein